MTQKEKELSFIDISGRLHYGVICRITNRDSNYKLVEIDYANSSLSFVSCIIPYSSYQTSVVDVKLDAVKPYLRPMSSMTEEERKEYKHLVAFSGSPDGSANFIDWLNKKMFAYRTIDGKDMFELGLALEAPEGMYNIKEQ